MATKSRLAAVLAGAVLLLAGCADGSHPGSAAAIGDTEISLSRLDDVVTAVSAVQGQPISPTAALQLMVNTELAQQVAGRRSVSVSDAEVASALPQAVQDPTLLAKFEANPVANGFLRDYTRGLISVMKIGGASGVTDPGAREALQKGGQIVVEEATKIGVDVNPRYGKWTGDQINSTSGSLSTPFQAEPSAAQDQQPPQK